MEKGKVKRNVTLIIVIAVILFVVWFLIVYPLIDFNKKEESVLDASKKYYEKNINLLPEEESMSTVKLRTLLEQKYVGTIKSTYGAEYCDVDSSWVKVKRKSGKYSYYVYLDCGKMKSSIDHEGPDIKLKGESTIEIEKGSTYNDQGIESIIDNTDGKMDTSKVTVDGSVNTKKIGTYTITYTAVDSFENKSTVKRVVKVIQTLNKVVSSDTDKDNLYKGNVNNNYIEFSNMLFRIVGLNSDGSVKLISAEAVGTVNYDDINTWLNDYYYEHLTSKAKKYVVKGSYCNSTIKENDVGNVKTCKAGKKQNVGLLSVSDYNKSIKDNDSYLYPNTIAWTSDQKDKNEAWTTKDLYLNSEKAKNMAFNKKYNFTLYPVINIKKDIKLTSGDGTKASPYKFESEKVGQPGDKINTRYTGEYVSYGNVIYRIIDGNLDGSAKVISTSVVSDNSVGYSDTDKSKIYNPTKKGNVGYYIENELSKSIKKDIFIKKEIEVPIYDKLATYSGKKNVKKYKVSLAAPDMYEMFSGVNSDTTSQYWLRNSSKEQFRKYLVSNTNIIYYNQVLDTMQAGVRVVGYINKDATILSGKGTYSNPYILEK